MKKFNLIIDFDSTIIQLETIEVIAELSLKNIPEKNKILNKIKKITNQAMAGKMSFQDALDQRIAILNIQQKHINQTIKFLKKKISVSFLNNLDLFKRNGERCFIISGGFKEIIWPILKPYGFKKENIFANTLLTNAKNNTLFVDKKNDLSKDNGKSLVSKKIKGHNIIIGDGYTDYEIKKTKNAELFILFTENIFRKELKNKADYIAKDFYEVFNYINKC